MINVGRPCRLRFGGRKRAHHAPIRQAEVTPPARVAARIVKTVLDRPLTA
jgi:hypothetical protein